MLGLPQASAISVEVDYLFLGLLAMTLAVLALVFGLMLRFSIQFWHLSGKDRTQPLEKTWKFEVTWTTATLVGFLGLFIWGADLYARLLRPAPDTQTVTVIAKQWMWKAEHPDGQREINALHLPVGRPVQLRMTSEDVIHDFGLPELRLKHDVLPGRYDYMSFTPTRVGTYQLYCDQYCGTDHASMIGQLVVMSEPDFAAWLARNGTSESMVQAGHRLFIQYGCSGCHRAGGNGGGGTVRAPALDGLFGSPVPLADGSVVTADDRYLHDSITMPQSQVVASYEPLMPSFAGVIGEDDIVRIIAYLKSLAASP